MSKDLLKYVLLGLAATFCVSAKQAGDQEELAMARCSRDRNTYAQEGYPDFGRPHPEEGRPYFEGRDYPEYPEQGRGCPEDRGYPEERRYYQEDDRRDRRYTEEDRRDRRYIEENRREYTQADRYSEDRYAPRYEDSRCAPRCPEQPRCAPRCPEPPRCAPRCPEPPRCAPNRCAPKCDRCEQRYCFPDACGNAGYSLDSAGRRRCLPGATQEYKINSQTNCDARGNCQEFTKNDVVKPQAIIVKRKSAAQKVLEGY